MWICLNNAFISIVDKSKCPENLVVRARRAGDLESVFPDHAELVHRGGGTDYEYRIDIPRAAVSKAIADAVSAIDYPNFKNSVADEELLTAYNKIWGVMVRLQKVLPSFMR